MGCFAEKNAALEAAKNAMDRMVEGVEGVEGVARTEELSSFCHAPPQFTIFIEPTLSNHVTWCGTKSCDCGLDRQNKLCRCNGSAATGPAQQNTSHNNQPDHQPTAVACPIPWALALRQLRPEREWSTFLLRGFALDAAA